MNERINKVALLAWLTGEIEDANQQADELQASIDAHQSSGCEDCAHAYGFCGEIEYLDETALKEREHAKAMTHVATHVRSMS